MALLDRTNSYSGVWCTADHIAYQNASRAGKLWNEISQEKRENQAFIQNMEQNKMMQNIEITTQAEQAEQAEQGGKAKGRGRSQVAETICAAISDRPEVRIQTTRKVRKRSSNRCIGNNNHTLD
jgi:hypothetical protein